MAPFSTREAIEFHKNEKFKRLMEIYREKGVDALCEFDIAFLVNMNNELTPHNRMILTYVKVRQANWEDLHKIGFIGTNGRYIPIHDCAAQYIEYIYDRYGTTETASFMGNEFIQWGIEHHPELLCRLGLAKRVIINIGKRIDTKA